MTERETIIALNMVEAYGIANTAKERAISALEKQIPKKPRIDYNGVIHKEHCPNCNRSLFPNEHHCECGQRIDWEGDSE